MEQPALHRTVVVFDVADFTNPARTASHQHVIHQALYRMLDVAFAESSIDLHACEVEDRGDGVLILLPPDVPKILLADRLPGRLIAGLKRYNDLHSKHALVQLRVVLHAGEVRRDEHGAVSVDINLAFRILESAQPKEALRSSGGVLAVIASDRFYQDVILQDPAAEPELFRKFQVAVKRTVTQAWLRLPDSGPQPPGQLVLDPWPRNELEPLQKWLTGISVPYLPILARRAAGPAAPAVREGADAWDVFEHLMDVNAGDDGFPPALAFLEILSRVVEQPVQTNLAEWVDEQARRLRLEPILRARRDHKVELPVAPRLHLLIMVEPDAIDPSRFLISSWRQDDPDEWPPPRGDTFPVRAAEIESQVDELVVDAERAWSDQGYGVGIELLVPRALLHLPVHRWYKERGSGQPRLLCMDYPIVLRSLERMRFHEWHRVWRQRWRTMREQPSPDRVHFSAPEHLTEPHRIEALLRSPQWTLMVLAGAPSPTPVSGRDELDAALRAGLPALIWHSEVSSDALREVVTWMLDGDGLVDLPVRVQDSRLATFEDPPPPFNVNVARDLVVLWDDPGRTVLLDQPLVHPRP